MSQTIEFLAAVQNIVPAMSTDTVTNLENMIANLEAYNDDGDLMAFDEQMYGINDVFTIMLENVALEDYNSSYARIKALWLEHSLPAHFAWG